MCLEGEMPSQISIMVCVYRKLVGSTRHYVEENSTSNVHYYCGMALLDRATTSGPQPDERTRGYVNKVFPVISTRP